MKPTLTILFALCLFANVAVGQTMGGDDATWSWLDSLYQAGWRMDHRTGKTWQVKVIQPHVNAGAQTKDTLPMPSWIVPGTMKSIMPYYNPYEGTAVISELQFMPYTGKVDSQFSAYILSIFVGAYSRYEKECWADSTLTEGATFRDFESGNHYWAEYHPKPWRSIGNLLWLENRYTHRQPSFPGFIEWLRRQR